MSELLIESNEQLTCSICLDEIISTDDNFKHSCNNIFHIQCISKLMDFSHSCPICRLPLIIEPEQPTMERFYSNTIIKLFIFNIILELAKILTIFLYDYSNIPLLYTIFLVAKLIIDLTIILYVHYIKNITSRINDFYFINELALFILFLVFVFMEDITFILSIIILCYTLINITLRYKFCRAIENIIRQ